MKRWSRKKCKEVENLKVDEFINDIIDVYKKHNLSIGHEDHYGSFEIEDIHNDNIKWIKDASITF